MARAAKFGGKEEDIKAGLTLWEVACKPALIYGAEVWACSSKADEVRIEQIQDWAGRRVLGLVCHVPVVVVRGNWVV